MAFVVSAVVDVGLGLLADAAVTEVAATVVADAAVGAVAADVAVGAATAGIADATAAAIADSAIAAGADAVAAGAATDVAAGALGDLALTDASLGAAGASNLAATEAAGGAWGATDASLGAAGAANAANTLPPVVDAVGTVVNANLPEATIASGMKSLGKAGLEAIGLGGLSAAQIGGLLAAGALAPSVIKALGIGGATTATKAAPSAPVNVAFRNAPISLAEQGVNPGWISPQPMYTTTDDVQAKYYWGDHPYAQTTADLANYNNVPGAPATPWGIQQGPQPFDVNSFIRNTINPQWQAASAGSTPELYRPQPTQTSVVGTPIATPVAAPAGDTTQAFLVPADQAALQPVQPDYQLSGYPVGAAKVMSYAPVNSADIINAALKTTPIKTI